MVTLRSTWFKVLPCYQVHSLVLSLETIQNDQESSFIYWMQNQFDASLIVYYINHRIFEILRPVRFIRSNVRRWNEEDIHFAFVKKKTCWRGTTDHRSTTQNLLFFFLFFVCAFSPMIQPQHFIRVSIFKCLFMMPNERLLSFSFWQLVRMKRWAPWCAKVIKLDRAIWRSNW